MSKIKRTICDKCHKELKQDKAYYNVDIDKFWEGQDTGKTVLKRGDYCEDCFEEIILKEMQRNIKEDE